MTSLPLKTRRTACRAALAPLPSSLSRPHATFYDELSCTRAPPVWKLLEWSVWAGNLQGHGEQKIEQQARQLLSSGRVPQEESQVRQDRQVEWIGKFGLQRAAR